MSFSYEGLDMILSLASMLIALVALVLVARYRGKIIERADDKEYADRQKEIDGRLDQIERGQAKLQSEVEDIPGIEELHKLELAAAEARGDMKQLSERLAGVEGTVTKIDGTVTRIDTWLREREK